MPKRCLITFIFLLALVTAKASHITGGEIIYRFISKGAGVTNYRITLLLFRDVDCFNCAQMPQQVAMGIYDNDTRMRVTGTDYQFVDMKNMTFAPVNALPTCIKNPPNLNYQLAYFEFDIGLPDNKLGYTVSYQTCCRVDGIANTIDRMGATYTTEIPGANILGVTESDNSSEFSTGISVVCYNTAFELDFSATDPDPQDKIVYELCNAYDGGAARDATYNFPADDPFLSIPYSNGYMGDEPLGFSATIDRNTGIITGIAPDAGKYIVSVCATSYRNGRAINTHRKDFIVTVAPCDLAGADLKLNYISCDGFTVSRFENLNTSPLNKTFFWEFGDGTTSAEEFPSHTYKDTGVYNLKLTVNEGTSCTDAATARVFVFPGYNVDFTSTSPVCIQSPINFNDITTAKYGVVNSVRWDFGDARSNSDSSRLKSPAYTYPALGDYLVTLIATSSKGCVDTMQKTVSVLDKQPFKLTNDTLICTSDTLQLSAIVSGSGTISWTPNYMIDNTRSFSPKVSPDVTTTYVANYADANGCKGTDSVKVNVTGAVTLRMPADSSICLTDQAILRPQSNALYFDWSPTEDLVSRNGNAITVSPKNANNTYTLTAGISKKCFTTGSVNIKTAPYPVARISPDTTICVNSSVQISASGGDNYAWSAPLASIGNPTISNPVVAPRFTTTYTVMVTENRGCPKPAFETVTVNVVGVEAEAGPRDTSIVLGQSLQLLGTGGVTYSWSPSTYLDNANIPNPIANPDEIIDYVLTVAESSGCIDRDTISVYVFKSTADLYVPSAFSPDGDGLNDVLTPIPMGLKRMNYFRIYNRFGQLMFETSELKSGWNGRFKGVSQQSGNYVWQAEVIDYLDKKLMRKGNIVLIR